MISTLQVLFRKEIRGYEYIAALLLDLFIQILLIVSVVGR